MTYHVISCGDVIRSHFGSLKGGRTGSPGGGGGGRDFTGNMESEDALSRDGTKGACSVSECVCMYICVSQ